MVLLGAVNIIIQAGVVNATVHKCSKYSSPFFYLSRNSSSYLFLSRRKLDTTSEHRDKTKDERRGKKIKSVGSMERYLNRLGSWSTKPVCTAVSSFGGGNWH
jgi:hypothetical protein